MAGKLNIRRVGSLLPTLCLLVITAIGIVVAWLGTCGFPESLLRYVEKQAGEQGIHLKLDSVRAAMVQGPALCVEGITIYLDADAKRKEAPLATVQRVTVGLNFPRLLRGEIWPSVLRVEGGDIRIPLREDAEGRDFHVSSLKLLGNGYGNALRLTSGTLQVQGIPVTLRGSISREILLQFLQKDQPENTEKIDLKQLLGEHRELLDQIAAKIEEQHWNTEETPSLDLRINGESEWRISVRSRIPSYDSGPFLFRDTEVDVEYAHETVTINSLKFRTVEPDSSAALQGAYSISDRHLSFNMRSNAALLAMMQRFGGEEAHVFLSKFSHAPENPPHLSLEGDVVFEENFSLSSARLRGRVEQKQLKIGSSLVEELYLSFFYSNGDFNIDRLELKLPDGSLQVQATAKDGEGQAQIAADLQVQRVFSLLRDLADLEPDLPEGLVLDNRVKLQLHARLDVPTFKPGGTEWQDFVPTFHMLGLKLNTKSLSYLDHYLEEPYLELHLEGVKNLTNNESGSMRQVRLTLRARRADLPARQRDASSWQISEPVLDVVLHGSSLTSAGLPKQVKMAQAELKAAAITEISPTAQTISVASPEKELEEKETQVSASLSANALRVNFILRDVQSNEKGIPISAASAALVAQVQDVVYGDWTVQSVELTLDDVGELKLSPADGKFFSSAHLQTGLHGLLRDGVALGEASADMHLQEQTKGHVNLSFTPAQSDAIPASLEAVADWSNPQEIVLRDVQLHAPSGVLALVPGLLQTEMEDLQMPQELTVRGSATLDATLRLLQANAELQAPGLVRTPQRQKVFRGKQIPLDVAAVIRAHRSPDDQIAFNVHLDVMHETGKLNADVRGSTTGKFRVTGTNTIRPDIVDALIDNEDAHSIIRDFRFNDASRSTITDIAVDVDLSSGTAVDSYCRVNLENAEYLLSVIEDTPDGGERLRRDLGNNPYTRVNHAACAVIAHVRLDCRKEDGTPIPDETVITIRDPLLVYDNTPWLGKNKIKKGVRETRLSGQEVVIDVEHSFVELRQIKGAVYPAYSLGMFFADLYGFLEDIHLARPATVETAYCLFPIYDDCKESMRGTIRVEAPQGAFFHFLGTEIPMEDFSGFISLSDSAVLLDRLNACTWEGVLNGSVRILISGRHTGFDGYVRAQCMNLQKIAAAYDSKQAPALCNGEIRFNSPSPDLDKIRAYGNLHIKDGDLISLSIFRPVGSLITDLPKHFERMEQEARTKIGKPETKPGFFSRVISSVFRGLGSIVGKTGGSIGNTAGKIPGMNHLIAYNLQEARANFHITNGWIYTKDMIASGSNLDVKLVAGIDLDTMEISGHLWPSISSLPTVILSPLTILSDFMVDVVLYGQASDPKWRIALDRRLRDRHKSASSGAANATERAKKE